MFRRLQQDSAEGIFPPQLAIACSLCTRVGSWQEQSEGEGGGGRSCPRRSRLPLRLLVSLKVGRGLPPTCSSFSKSARHPGGGGEAGRKKKTTSETSVGSHSGQLGGYHGNPLLEPASISRKSLPTIISTHKGGYTVDCRICLVSGFCSALGPSLRAPIQEGRGSQPSLPWHQA